MFSLRERFKKGLIQVYTGDGKGKTTAALGQAVRAVGHGFRVCIIQFLKGSNYTGELFAVERLYPNIDMFQFGKCCRYSGMIKTGQLKCKECGDCFDWDKDLQEDKDIVCAAMNLTGKVLSKGEYDIVILDEISHAVNVGFIKTAEVIHLLKNRVEWIEIILTGKDMPKDIIDTADLVTEMKFIKHPFEKGIESRRGIEY